MITKIAKSKVPGRLSNDDSMTCQRELGTPTRTDGLEKCIFSQLYHLPTHVSVQILAEMEIFFVYISLHFGGHFERYPVSRISKILKIARCYYFLLFYAYKSDL